MIRFAAKMLVLMLASSSSLTAQLAAKSVVRKPACANKQTDKQLHARVDGLIAEMTIAERIAQLQDRAPAIPRLGLPAYNWWNEGLHGIARNGYATVFPQAIGLAATWDASLMEQVGDVVSTEARAKFNPHRKDDSRRFAGLTIWSPNINIFRDPRWGRGQETYGEDPFLTAMLGTSFVEGIQGKDPFYFKAQATPKHFVAHSGPERGRDSFNSVVSEHDLADTYLPAFHALLTQGGAAALMCSYNAINGVPSCANKDLLQGVVSDKWGFRGYVVSDCDAVGNLTEYHHSATDKAHGAADALKAGVDLDCGNSYLALADALKQGLTTQAAVDQSLHRLLYARMQLGFFDEDSCTRYNRITADEVDTAEHQKLALRAAEESIVLLRNEGILPLKPSTKLAVIGPNADSIKTLEGNYKGTASAPVTPLDGLLKAFDHVTYAQGSVLAAGLATPIPRTALRTGESENSAPGLVAEYFFNAKFEGKPTLTTTVPRLDLDLDRVGPSPLVPATGWSARWSGFLVPPAAGDYTLVLNVKRCWDCEAHDGVKLYLDGKAAITDAGTKEEQLRYAVHFGDVAPHTIGVEMAHTGDDAGIALAWEAPAGAELDEAVAAVKGADVVAVFVGLSPELEGEALQLKLDGFDGGDRTSLGLPAAQLALLKRLRELHKPVILVLQSGSAVALDGEALKSAAILEAWYPGEEGGTALAEILAGKVSPSGRLPVTFYRSAEDLPAFTDYSMAKRTYRYFSGPVEFGFGFGLSYTNFDYSSVRLASATVAANESLRASVTVTNRSGFAAQEVAELYLIPPAGLAGAPRLALKGIQRVTLKAGESRVLRFVIAPELLSTVDPTGKRSVRLGNYRVAIGRSQPALTDGVGFRIVAPRTKLPSHPKKVQDDDSRPVFHSISLATSSPKWAFVLANHGRMKQVASASR